jgi:hypothetical protein
MIFETVSSGGCRSCLLGCDETCEASPAPYTPGHTRDSMCLCVADRAANQHEWRQDRMHLPRGQLELRVNDELKDPTQRIRVCGEFGRISTRRGDPAHHGASGRGSTRWWVRARRAAGYPLSSAEGT